MMAFTYALVLFFTVIICFIASFDRRIQFNREFSAFLKAAVCVAIPFVAWDIWFTAHGVWWFDTQYTLGITLAGLPLEEWLFFICIPFSCVFTYVCFEKFFNLSGWTALNNLIVFATVVGCCVIALLHHDKMYTLITAIVTLATVLYLHFVAQVDWIGKASMVFTVLMLGFFPVNGVLTGTGIPSPIVNYNPEEFMGIRMLTIPVEDAVYGYTQFLLVLHFFFYFQKKAQKQRTETSEAVEKTK